MLSKKLFLDLEMSLTYTVALMMSTRSNASETLFDQCQSHWMRGVRACSLSSGKSRMTTHVLRCNLFAVENS